MAELTAPETRGWIWLTTEDTRSWLLRALEVEAGRVVVVVVVTGLELERMVVEPRLLELLLIAEFTAPETRGWICSTTVEMRSSWEKEDEDCCPEDREEEEDPEKELEPKLELESEKELEPKFEDERDEDPDEKDPELEIPEDEDKEELPEFEELKLDAGFSLIWTSSPGHFWSQCIPWVRPRS